MKYYVYWGYVDSDNYDEFPTHKLEVFDNKKDVVDFIKKIKDPDYCSFSCKESQNVRLVVIEGNELKLTPIKIETDYKLENK